MKVNRQIKKKDVAECIGVCYKALDNKVNGRVAFTWPEVKKIRHDLFPDLPADDLFVTAAEIGSNQDSA